MLASRTMHNERQIKRIPCNACGGNGFTVSKARKVCACCKGNGWIEPTPKNEQVCPECKGDGYCMHDEQISCLDCSAKGYLVSIVEITPVLEACLDCDDEGYITNETACPDCDGTGTEDSSDPYTTVTKSAVCRKCKGTGRFVHKTRRPTCKGSGAFQGDGFEEYPITPCNPPEYS